MTSLYLLQEYPPRMQKLTDQEFKDKWDMAVKLAIEMEDLCREFEAEWVRRNKVERS